MLGLSPETEVLRLLHASAIAPGIGGWQPFLEALAALTRAPGALLRIEAAGRHEAQSGQPFPLPPPAILRGLRRDRVYAQDELGTPAPLRLIRLVPQAEAQVFLAIGHPRRDFRAIDGAHLDRLAPHLAQAVESWLVLAAERARAQRTARQAAALGAGWLWLDATGRLVEADAAARSLLDTLPGLQRGAQGRLVLADPLLARAFRQALDRAVTGSEGPQILTLRRAPLLQLVLHPGLAAPAPGVEPVIAASVRAAPQAGALDPALVARALDLSRSEARLAVLLCDGLTLAEAAAALGWTAETARSASKRIFARTGTRGQSDLIRLMQGGTFWLARG